MFLINSDHWPPEGEMIQNFNPLMFSIWIHKKHFAKPVLLWKEITQKMINTSSTNTYDKIRVTRKASTGREIKKDLWHSAKPIQTVHKMKILSTQGRNRKYLNSTARLTFAWITAMWVRIRNQLSFKYYCKEISGS